MSHSPDRQHYNVTFALLAVAATTFALPRPSCVAAARLKESV